MLTFSYDPKRDILTVEGVDYPGDLFRQLARPEAGRLVRLLALPNGAVLMQEAKDER